MTMHNRTQQLRQRLADYNDGVRNTFLKQPLGGTAGGGCPITLTADFVEWLGTSLMKIDYRGNPAVTVGAIAFRAGQEDIIQRLLSALDVQENENGSTVQPTQST